MTCVGPFYTAASLAILKASLSAKISSHADFTEILRAPWQRLPADLITAICAGFQRAVGIFRFPLHISRLHIYHDDTWFDVCLAAVDAHYHAIYSFLSRRHIG